MRLVISVTTIAFLFFLFPFFEIYASILFQRSIVIPNQEVCCVSLAKF